MKEVDMEIEKKLEKENIIENSIERKQNYFLESTLGKVVNKALDIGISMLLPDFIDKQVINIKDNLFEYGLKEGIDKTIKDAIEIGKSSIGIFTGNFENINQMQSAIEEGGIIDGISNVLDMALKAIDKNGIINSNILDILSKGKNVILDILQNNIEETFKNQINKRNNLVNNIEGWKEGFKNKDFTKMEKEYINIKKEINNIAPLVDIINQSQTIENLHQLIKNNGQNFNLTQEQIELASKLKV